MASLADSRTPGDTETIIMIIIITIIIIPPVNNDNNNISSERPSANADVKNFNE